MNAQLPAFDTAWPAPAIELPQPGQLSADERTALLEAALEVGRCQRALAKAGLNVVGELLKGHDGFYEMNHYPDGDVYDRDSHAQYYYHAHREGAVEHGHFHTFLRGPGIPGHLQPLTALQTSEPWPQGKEAIAHLIAVSMDAWGQPIGLFACNRWVTGETWYPAEAVKQMLPAFSIDHAHPSWPTNLWLTALLKLFRPHIESLIEHRDRVIEAWQTNHPGQDVFEDRALEITGYLPISVEEWSQALAHAQATPPRARS
ncbi:MAG TPA: hypothetical protein VIO83_03240 [Pseudomonas sp.]